MKSVLTGPALGGTEANWADYDREDLYGWIRNSQKMIAAGHPRAVELWNQYKPTVMTAFDQLTDEDIESVLLYIDGVYTGTYGVTASVEGGAVVETESKEVPAYLYWVLLLVLGVLSLTLARIIGNLDRLNKVKDGQIVKKKSLVEHLTSKGVISFLVFALVILGGYTTVNNAVSLGRQEGYAPKQPIKFSHETHAGVHKIDCQYCHDGARRSKHSVIPAANTCMNCHKAIKKGSIYGTAELTKIYASIGFDPRGTGKYIDGYEDMSEESIKEIYTDWISQNYVQDKELTTIDREGEREVEAQWKAVKESLTNEQKNTIQGPIEWIRIHNLPDHVYFNHAQHVSIGELECQQCHGKVEEMEVMQQHSPLSMGWCINCHRQTEVKFAGNDYYNSYAKYHEELANGERDRVTVEDIGGLECQKCHY
jgi:hypothetical protein